MKARIVSWQYRLILLTILVIASFNASAFYGQYHFCLDGIYYFYYNGELEVVTADADLEEAIIPSHILFNGDYRPVTKISEEAFKDKNITSVTIPETIVLIEHSAFARCSYLNSVYITDLSAWCNINFKNASSNPATLAKHLFLNGEEIIDLQIPDSVTSIGDYAFNYLKDLKSVTIHDSVVAIGKNAFSGCVNLSSISIGNSVTSIPSGCFEGCKSLTSITIPNTISRIYDYAFAGCDSLISLTIPASVTMIYESAFKCRGIKELIIEDSTELLHLSVCKPEYYFEDSIVSGLFYYCPLENLYLGRNIEYPSDDISTSPFYNQVNLSNITISHFVTSINRYAFGNCSGLTSMTIPNSVTEIKAGAFDGCNGIKELILEDGENDISMDESYNREEGLFHDCPLETLYCGRTRAFSDEMNSLKSPFLNQLNLRNVVISDSVRYIAEGLFKGCSGLTSLTISDNVHRIAGHAFEGCSSLTSLTISDNVLIIGSHAFNGCSSLTSLEIGSRITTISDHAFKGCHSLTSITIPPSVTKIEIGAFSECSRLLSVAIPSAVTRIKACAFEGCSELTQLIIEDGAETLSIEDRTFDGCPLETLYLGRDSGDAFSYSQTLKELTIGKDLTKINDRSFPGCSALTSVTIGESVTSIGSSAFHGCNSLTSVTIPKSVTEIGNYAFNRCNALTQLIIKDGAEILSIGDWTFDYCPLETLYLGRNLAYDVNPIRSKETLTDVHIGHTVTSLNKDLFMNCNIKNIDFYSYRIDGIESCSIDSSIPINIMTDSDFSGIGDTNLTYFKNITLISEGKYYGLVKSKSNLNFSNCLFSEKDVHILALGECQASVSDPNMKVIFRGEEITNKLAEPNHFTFTPSEYHDDNYFGVYGSSDNPTAIRTIALKSAGSLFDELGLLNIDKVEALILSGDLNGTDIMTINRMDALKYLDISNANIVAGGETYRGDLKTENDVIGSSFLGSVDLELLYLPNSAKIIRDDALSFHKNLRCLHVGNSIFSIGVNAFGDCSRLGILTIPNSVTSIGSWAFYNCSSLTSVTIPASVTSIDDSAFNGCKNLTAVHINDLESWCRINFGKYGANPTFYAHHLYLNEVEIKDLQIPYSINTIPARSFYGCSSITSLTIPESVTSIGEYAFSDCPNITKVVSLNPLPPVIDSSTFNSNIGECATLFVPKGSLVKYWVDPVWKNFINISDNLLFLQTIPNVRYGESEIDLSQYAPEGVALTYKSSNEDVVKINGTTMQIVGAGEATVAAILDEEGTIAELVGQMRRIFVDQADLIVTVEDIIIEEGTTVPDFTYLTEGLQYDDTLDDIEKLPVPLYDVDETSPVGEYEVRFTDGYDRNYKIATRPAKITVTNYSQAEGIIANPTGTEIEVYDLDGRFVFRGERADAHLSKGIYIIRQGNVVRKVTVR